MARSMVALIGLAAAAPAHAGSLQRVVEQALEHSVLDGASVGVVVVDAEGEVRVAVDPDRRLIPASTAKWVTAAAAAETLTLDYRFETWLGATGFTEGDVLHGDLIVQGSGDPSLGDPDPAAFVAEIARLLRTLEIRRVDGAVVVDASRFGGPPHGRGWMWDDFTAPYSPPFTAANIAHNLSSPAVPCPAHDGPGSPVLDPPACLGEVVRTGLIAAGLEVTGPSAVRPAPEAAPIAVVQSPPLRDLLRTVLENSDNLYAECIARALDGRPGAVADGARARIDAVLGAAGVPPGRVSLADGSGLSRYSYASAAGMVRLATWVQGQPWGDELVGLLPVAGRDGTLAGRMVGTPAEGRVRAKTGSMTGVRNLVGYVDVGPDADGRLTFAILFNGVTAPQAEVIAVQDRVVALLAASNGRRVKRKVAAALLGVGG